MTPEERRADLRRRQLAARIQWASQQTPEGQPAQARTSLLEQGMSGINEGIGGTLGAPVDIASLAINSMARPRIEANMEMGPDGSPTLNVSDIEPRRLVENPVGGSQWVNENVLGPTISDQPPQGAMQRATRRIGQEVGANVVPALGLLGKTQSAARSATVLDDMARGAQSNPAGYLAAETAGSIGAGAGGAAAQEVAPNSALAELLGQALGGGAAATGMYAAAPRPKAPSMDDLKARQSAAYGVVDNSTSRLTPQATSDLQQRIADRAASDGMDPYLAPKASRVSQRIGTLDQPSLSEVEKARRLVGRDVAGAVDPTDRAIGAGMKDEITEYLDSLSPNEVVGDDPAAAVAALHEGRDVTRRMKKSQEVSNQQYKAENRAATSGTGGNEVNAIRQNIRQILDNPRRRRGYTPEEIAAMEDIVRGTPTQNALRLLGRFSPTSGALPAMAGGGLVATGIGAANPWLAVPSMVGMAAKGGAEMLTKRGVSNLDAMIRNGGPVAGKALSGAQKSALSTLLLSQILNGGGE